MVVQDRFSALQNETVRLFHIFEYDGNLLQLPAVPTVTILAQDGITVLEVLTAVMQTPGYYYADYNVPITAPIGRYYDKWEFVYTSGAAAQEVTTHFEVHPADSILNFSSSIVSEYYTDLMERGIRDLSNYFIYEAMHIPVYGEQAQRTADGARFNFAYKHWNRDPRPTIRVNNRIEDKGWYSDYDGNVFFDKAKSESDIVMGYYNFSYFSKNDMAGFLDVGLRALNSIPPATYSYATISQIPMEWWHGVQVYAAMQALRRLLLGMTFQETSIIFGEGEKLSSARDIIKTLYEEYSEIWKEVSVGIKKKLPGMGSIILPEYTLPGGRARWYRYMYVSGVSG